jgi:membrane-associated phospholipid phosphatase
LSWFKKRYGQAKFRLMDINCLAFLGLIAILLVFFHRAVPSWPKFVILHLVMIFVILEIVRLGERLPRRRGLRFLRTFYPVVVILFGWGEVDALGRMLFGSYWATDLIIRAEQLIWGGPPAAWFQKFYRPWLDEAMAVFYSGYYLYLILAILPLFIKKKYEEALAALSVGTFVLFANYLLFYLIPVLSPAMVDSLQTPQTRSYSGYIVAAFTRAVQAHAAVRGGTFPSSHISEALIWALVAFRYNRRVGAALLAGVPAVAVSTVYLNYHYALDPIAGLLLGALLYPVALRIVKARGEDPRPEPKSKGGGRRTPPAAPSPPATSGETKS